jgi:alpha-L-fucosidase
MRLVLVFLLLISVTASWASGGPDKDVRMKWWREARLGMFIHWGLYSIPAGKWGDKTNYGEWIREEAHIPVGEYEHFRDQFNPVDFDANKWVKMAKDAGFKYIVITTKHHDGFCLFDSKYTDWDIAHTPFKRDIMKEMADACHRQGIKICWYHSIMDWHEPDYLPRRSWEEADRPVDGANFDRYDDYLRNEVTELLTNYGPIGVMWFDGQWESTWSDKYGKPLYDLCRKLQPNVIVNDRVSQHGNEVLDSESETLGDFTTPEQYIPPTGLPGVDWETCMTMNDHWGYNAYDPAWKSNETLIRNIVDVASKGGNYLLNIGPMSNGEFPPQAVERLNAIGQYMKVNGSAVYDTTASVFENLPWGRSTTKRVGGSTTLFLHVFDWPKDGVLRVPGIGNNPRRALILGGGTVRVTRDENDLLIHVPQTAPGPYSSTVALTVTGDPIIYQTPKIVAPATILVKSLDVKIDANRGQDVRYTLDGSDPTAESELYREPISIASTATLRAACFVGGKRVTAIATQTFNKVQPSQGLHMARLTAGFNCDEFHGKWTVVPDFESMTPDRSFAISSLSPPETNGTAEENVGRLYEGFLNVKADDVYLFSLTSDDGSKMWIDGNVVVDNDQLHSALTRTSAAALGVGEHSIKIAWFNAAGAAALDVRWGPVGQKTSPFEVRDVSHRQRVVKGASAP